MLREKMVHHSVFIVYYFCYFFYLQLFSVEAPVSGHPRDTLGTPSGHPRDTLGTPSGSRKSVVSGAGHVRE